MSVKSPLNQLKKKGVRFTCEKDGFKVLNRVFELVNDLNQCHTHTKMLLYFIFGARISGGCHM